MSPTSTSASSPSATTREKPSPRAFAQPITPLVNAFDADTHATPPGTTAHDGAPNTAPRAGVITPTLAGPTTRSKNGRAAASVRRVHSRPRVPRSPSCLTISGHVDGGVHNTATVGASGKSSMPA